MSLVCIDVDGTVSDRFERPTIAGAPRALAEIRRAHTLRLVTNATSMAHAELAAKLREQGLLEDPAELVTPAATARRMLTDRGHASGILIVDEPAREDFAWFTESATGPAVLLASEAHDLRIADLQPAFRRLLDGAELYTAQQNRYFRKGGELVTDLGPVAAFLAYASGRAPQNLGKPSRLLFEGLAGEARCDLHDVVMVGDDAEFDASGAVAIGMRGVLVRTGKYRAGDEEAVSPKPTAVLDSVADLPAWLAAHSITGKPRPSP
jgi:HAD superfamily hydrolase (TIGR01458 family)